MGLGVEPCLDRSAVTLGKQLDLEMLLFLHSFERTAKQYESLLRAAGFDGVRCYPTNSAYSIVEGTCSR